MCYIQPLDEGLCYRGFPRGRWACDANDLESEPWRFVFCLLLTHYLELCYPVDFDLIEIAIVGLKGPPEIVNIRRKTSILR